MKPLSLGLLSLCLATIIGLTACQQNQAKPTPFLDEKKMVSLLYDVQILESTLQEGYRVHYLGDSIAWASVEGYQRIFSQYGLTDSSYKALIQYYTNEPEVFADIQKQVVDKLQKLDTTSR